MTPSEDISYIYFYHQKSSHTLAHDASTQATINKDNTSFPSGRVLALAFYSFILSNTSYEMQSIYFYILTTEKVFSKNPYGIVLIFRHRPDYSVHVAMCQWKMDCIHEPLV